MQKVCSTLCILLSSIISREGILYNPINTIAERLILSSTIYIVNIIIHPLLNNTILRRNNKMTVDIHNQIIEKNI